MDTCNNRNYVFNRRDMLRWCANGFGAIAKRLVELLTALGMKVLGIRRNPRGDESVDMAAIQEQINFLTNMQREQMVLDANLVSNELGAIAFTRPHELIELRDGKWVKKRPEDIPDRVQAAIKKISVRTMKDGSQEFSYELYDKMPALYKLGEHLGVGEAGHRDTGGNPFEDMDQEELDAIQTTMQKALDRRALIGEVEDA